MNELVEKRLEEIVENNGRVSLDEAWAWVGYASKQKAKERMISELDEGEEYLLSETVKQVPHQGGNMEENVEAKKLLLGKRMYELSVTHIEGYIWEVEAHNEEEAWELFHSDKRSAQYDAWEDEEIIEI